MNYRYWVKRAVGDLVLDTNADLAKVSMIDAVSAPGIMTAHVPAGTRTNNVAEDGFQVFGRFNTVIVAEAEDERHRWGGVCINASPGDRGGTDLVFLGGTGWWQRVPYLGQYSSWQRDVAFVLEDLFNESMRAVPSKLPMVLNLPTGGLGRTVGDIRPTPEPVAPVRRAGETMADYENRPEVKAFIVAAEAWDKEYGNNLPYTLSWWEAPYFGEEFDALAQETGFEYRERVQWVDRSKFQYRIVVDVDTTIRNRRTDIEFEDGVNVVLPLKVRDDEQPFATHVIGLGAGEGRDMVRAEARGEGNRLYQAEYLPAKDVRDRSRLQALTQNHLDLYDGGSVQVDEVTIWDTPGYAPVNSLRPGDEVMVKSQYTVPNVSIWRRIKRIERTPGSGTLKIGLERARD